MASIRFREDRMDSPMGESMASGVLPRAHPLPFESGMLFLIGTNLKACSFRASSKMPSLRSSSNISAIISLEGAMAAPLPNDWLFMIFRVQDFFRNARSKLLPAMEGNDLHPMPTPFTLALKHLFCLGQSYPSRLVDMSHPQAYQSI